jgi:hypothetical protein
MKKIFIPALLFLFVSSVALAETKFSFSGSYEFGGRYIMNNSLGNDDKLGTKSQVVDGVTYTAVDKTRSENAAYNFQFLDFNISATTDKFGLYVYSNPFDRKIGGGGTAGSPLDPVISGNYIDRAFATYAFLPNLVFVGGRVKAGGVLDDGAAPFAGGYEYLGFGSGAYNTLFSERVNGDGLGVIFVANENLNFTFVNERYLEADINANIEPLQGGGVDADGYILKANAAFGDVVVRPYISWVSLPKGASLNVPAYVVDSSTGIIDDSSLITGLDGDIRDVSLPLYESAHALAVYVGGGYNPKSGINVNAAFGINKIIDGVVDASAYAGAGTARGFLTVDAADVPLSFGGYLNVAFVQDMFTVGLEAAYASYTYEEADINVASGGTAAPLKAGLQGFYQFGGDFDRTYVIDQRLGDGSTSSGIPAMTTIQLYAAITPVEKLTILPRVAYYLSNVNEKNKSVAIGSDLLGLVTDSSIAISEDTTFLEIDLIASYAWTESTAIYGGLVYVQADKVDVVGSRVPNSTGNYGGVDSPNDKYSPDPAFGIAWGLATSF